ncbi:MAG: DUF2169 domain-containing protein [Nitrospira sp.]|nr:DUF2169 domain-containing protein [Nitrospira sp.]
MWAINNQTRFKADRAFVRDAEGAEIWIVAVRATFFIKGDEQVVVAEEQEDVCLAPKFFGEPGRSSLRYDMDLVRTKPGTDVIVHAHAHAPGGQPAPFADVGWQVGPVMKRLHIVGDRTWKKGLFGFSTSRPCPFVKMPICYERALGGLLAAEENAHRDPENPVGVGRAPVSGQPVPNCEYVGEPVRNPKAKLSPAGFGPIPCDWQSRAKLAGTYDDAWQKERQPLVPRDFQDAYFRCAPVDQQVNGFLQGGEEVVLVNLSAEGTLRFRLPRVSLGFSTSIDGGTTHHRGQLHTVIIEPEERRLIMVWQTALPCHHTLYTLKETVVIEKKRLPLGAQEESEAELAV